MKCWIYSIEESGSTNPSFPREKLQFWPKLLFTLERLNIAVNCLKIGFKERFISFGILRAIFPTHQAALLAREESSSLYSWLLLNNSRVSHKEPSIGSMKGMNASSEMYLKNDIIYNPYLLVKPKCVYKFLFSLTMKESNFLKLVVICPSELISVHPWFCFSQFNEITLDSIEK